MRKDGQRHGCGAATRQRQQRHQRQLCEAAPLNPQRFQCTPGRPLSAAHCERWRSLGCLCEMTSLLRIAAGKGGCPPIHAIVEVLGAPPGHPQAEELAVSTADGSEGTVPIPPDAKPGQTLRVVVPSAYPNWGAGPTKYAGDWVATYAAGAHAPGRGTWANERISPRIHSDPGFVLRQAHIDGGEPPNPAAERFRRAAERRNAAHVLAAKRHQARLTDGTPPPESLGGISVDEVREKAAEVVRLHAELVDAGGSGGNAIAQASAQPGRMAVGRPDSVVAAAERLRTRMAEGGAARHEAVTDLRFICRQNLRSVEREHQTAAGSAGVVEMLCEMIAAEQPLAIEQDERAAATWLLAQLCFKHRSNCARVIGCSNSLSSIINQAAESDTALRPARVALNQSGPKAAAFSLLCNLVLYGPDGTGTSVVEAGAVQAALTVLAAYENDILESESPDESDSDDGRTALEKWLNSSATRASSAQVSHASGLADHAPSHRATRGPETSRSEGPSVDLEMLLKAVILLESLAGCDDCRTRLVEAGVPDALQPLVTMSGLSTGHLPGQRVPFAGTSLGAVAARALADL